MEALANIAGVVQANPFHIYDDAKRQPVKCDLVVNPSQGWAVATELADGGPGLVLCPITLATAVCREYHIEPESLTLFVRYAFAANYESIYVLRFAAGGRDLFDGVRFEGANRQMVPTVDVPELMEALRAGQAPAATGRALRPVSAARA